MQSLLGIAVLLHPRRQRVRPMNAMGLLRHVFDETGLATTSGFVLLSMSFPRGIDAAPGLGRVLHVLEGSSPFLGRHSSPRARSVLGATSLVLDVLSLLVEQVLGRTQVFGPAGGSRRLALQSISRLFGGSIAV